MTVGDYRKGDGRLYFVLLSTGAIAALTHEEYIKYKERQEKDEEATAKEQAAADGDRSTS